MIATNGALANGHTNGNGNGKTTNGNGGGSTAPITLNLGATKVSFQTQADAPSCMDCGSIMVRNGSCYKCLNCGSAPAAAAEGLPCGYVRARRAHLLGSRSPQTHFLDIASILRAMGYFRLFRRIKIAPGVTINVSKSGAFDVVRAQGRQDHGRQARRPQDRRHPGNRAVLHVAFEPGPKSAAHVVADVVPPPGSAASTRWSTRSWVGVLIIVVVLAAVVGSCLGGAPADPAPTPPPAALGLVGQASPLRSTPRPEPTLLVASPLTTSAPATKKPTATPKPTTKPKAKPTPTPTPTDLSVKVTARTASVARNGTAKVSIKTSAKARCSIDVEYASGSSTAAGLVDKTASSTGAISWSWKVGGNTTRGTWPIYIDCELGTRSGSVDTSFTVR